MYVFAFCNHHVFVLADGFTQKNSKEKKKMSLPIEIPGLSPPSYLPLVYLLLGTGMYLPFPTSDFA